ncbi:hypothetical protein V5799_000282 [Amblyomma americanum]|uniref:Single domain-containing protein n=1 Tax=Amblyomma americanum TaxID=6943 RepID=A0AAQ4D3H2_AMBAM
MASQSKERGLGIRGITFPVILWLCITFAILTTAEDADEEQTDISDESLQIAEGRCYYRGLTLENGGTTKLSSPCEQWTCDADGKTVNVKGCSVRKYGSCLNMGLNATYPDCCPTSSPSC